MASEPDSVDVSLQDEDAGGLFGSGSEDEGSMYRLSSKHTCVLV